MEKTNIISALQERLNNLENWRKGKENKDKGTRKEDEEVCPNCGGDLQFVEDNIVYCPKCKEYFESKDEKEDEKKNEQQTDRMG